MTETPRYLEHDEDPDEGSERVGEVERAYSGPHLVVLRSRPPIRVGSPTGPAGVSIWRRGGASRFVKSFLMCIVRSGIWRYGAQALQGRRDDEQRNPC